MFFLPPQYSDSSIFWGRLIKNDLYPFLLGTVYWGVGRSQKLLLSGQLDKSGRRRTANQSGISLKSVAGKYPINLFSFYELKKQKNITQGHSFQAYFHLTSYHYHQLSSYSHAVRYICTIVHVRSTTSIRHCVSCIMCICIGSAY